MTIHIFNPDHEIALAMNQCNFTAPHAGRQLRSDLGFLPALWAKEVDFVLVEDVAAAYNAYRKLKLARRVEPNFVTLDDIKSIIGSSEAIEVKPWGWNKTIWTTLKKAGVPVASMPAEGQLDEVRTLANRSLAVELLTELSDIPGVTGVSFVCNTAEEVMEKMQMLGSIVVKAPWSSSGRGVRYLDKDSIDDNARKWIANTLMKQGTVIVEKKCNKVHDFAMEFMAESDGTVKACGISLFTTERGAYTGNILDTEESKQMMLEKYIPADLLSKVIGRIEAFLQQRINGVYVGPLGVDMMIVANEGNAEHPFLLNPCIEINLRRTMGHVALALSEAGQRGSMAIVYEGKSYKMKLQNS